MPSEGLDSGLNLDCKSVIKFEQLPTRPVKYELHLGSLFDILPSPNCVNTDQYLTDRFFFFLFLAEF